MAILCSQTGGTASMTITRRSLLPMKRCHLLIGLGLSSLVTPFLARSSTAQEETEDTVDYLFVQNAEKTKSSNA